MRCNPGRVAALTVAGLAQGRLGRQRKDNGMKIIVMAALAAATGLAGCETRGNPPGTEATRALDRASGTNVSGAYPSQSDGTRVNPEGTEATRALDRAAGTNTSGAYPSQSDGMPGNPPGTAAGRALDRAADTSDTGVVRPPPR